jgi:hypothetical protein
MDIDAHGGVLELAVKVGNTGVCYCVDMGKFFFGVDTSLYALP